MKRRRDKTDHDLAADAIPTAAGRDLAKPGMATADLEKYLVHLAHLDMPLALKIKLISAVADMMQSFVDRAFGDDPVQLVTNVRDRRNKTDTEADPSMIDLAADKPDGTNRLTSGFRRTSGPREEKATDT